MRIKLRTEFIKKHHFDNYEITPLKHDASLRRYFRLTKNKQTFILMDSPPPSEPVMPFIKVTQFLSENNFSVPLIHFQDTEHGFLILEDFGNNIINNYLDQHPKYEEKIYFLAIDNLIRLTTLAPPKKFPKHTKKLLMSGIKQFQKFYLESNNPELIELSNSLLDKLNYKNHHISLRDFHADNLVYLNNQKSYRQIGLLDYQDASLGFISYDLLSLLQDARKYISPKLQEKYLQYFLDNMPNLNQETFLQEYEILSFQRNSRIIGLFNKFNKLDNNSSYLKYLDNVFKYFKINLKSKHLTEIKYFLDN